MAILTQGFMLMVGLLATTEGCLVGCACEAMLADCVNRGLLYLQSEGEIEKEITTVQASGNIITVVPFEELSFIFPNLQLLDLGDGFNTTCSPRNLTFTVLPPCTPITTSTNPTDTFPREDLGLLMDEEPANTIHGTLFVAATPEPTNDTLPIVLGFSAALFVVLFCILAYIYRSHQNKYKMYDNPVTYSGEVVTI